MDIQNQPGTMKTVTDTFAAWKTVKDKLSELEKAYKWELQQHETNMAPFPTALQAEIANLQETSDRLLEAAQRALLKLKTPRSSRESGDSTWS